MQEMRTNSNAENSPIREITHGGQTYIMTSNPFTQPPIFNVIKASIPKGIFYGIVSLGILYFFYEGTYLFLLSGDIVMALAALYIQFILKSLVVNGKIRKVGCFDSANIKFGGVMMGILWSSFIRLGFFAFQLFSKDYTIDELKYFFSRCGILGYLSVGVAAIVIFFMLSVLLTPKRFDVREFHRKTIDYYNNLVKASQNIDKEQKEIPEYKPATFEYGELRMAPTTPKVESQPKPKAKTEKVVIPDSVHVQRGVEKPPVDKIKEKQVKRKKRNIDI